MIRLVTFYVPSRYAMMPVAFVWKNVVQRVVYMIPEHLRLPLGAAGSVAVILVGTFVTEESQDNTRANRAVSCFGLIVFVAGFWATSRDRKRVQWHTVIVGMLAQFVLAVFVLRTKAGVSLLPPVLFSDTKARAPSTTSSTSSPS
jgi:CNT family concentrative nucleoside transporter